MEIIIEPEMSVHTEADDFLTQYPEYKLTSALDELRQKDFARLDEQKHVYLDFTGGNLYGISLLEKHFDLLKDNIFGNPHSTNPSSLKATKLVEETREYVLKYFNAGDDYFCIFTPNASGALKIVGECYPFQNNGYFLLTLDNHNSVNGIRQFAKNKGAGFCYTPLEASSLFIDEAVLIENLDSHADKKNKLFAFPAQSNVSGIKHPLEYVKYAKERGWDVLLDAAAFVPSDTLNLKEVQPDFVSISFYKMFGYPTGIGCLLIKRSAFDKLQKPWYAGGTISLAANTYDGYYLAQNHERFEDGTVNYLGIPAISIGLRQIEEIGIDVINARIKYLSGYLLSELLKLSHSNGKELVNIFGSHDTTRRGGTFFMNFFDNSGKLIPFSFVESEANQKNISLRTGCFCNPGLDEVNNCITYEELQKYFTTHTEGNFNEMIDFTGKLRGSVRISLGMISNLADVLAFLKFARSFIQ